MKNQKHLSLAPGKRLLLNQFHSRKLSFVCNEGTAWITNPGDQKDYIVHSGEKIEIEVKSRRAGVLVESVGGGVELDVFAP